MQCSILVIADVHKQILSRLLGYGVNAYYVHTLNDRRN